MEVSFRSLLSFLEIPSALATAGFLKPIPKPLTQFQPPPSVQSLCQGLSQIGNFKKAQPLSSQSSQSMETLLDHCSERAQESPVPDLYEIHKPNGPLP